MNMIKTKINNRWELLLPEFRAKRPGWAQWEYERNRFMYAAIRPGDTILDIGSEIGDQSALYASWIGETGNMIMAEPTAAYWPWIRDIWEANELKLPNTTWSGYVSNRTNSLPAWEYWPPEVDYAHLIEGDEGFDFSRMENKEFARTHITVDGLASRTNLDIDILTMDVEGAEYNVLLGASSVLIDDKPIVFISIHPEFIRERFGYTPDDVFSHMELLGYEGSYLGYDHEQHWMFKHKTK